MGSWTNFPISEGAKIFAGGPETLELYNHIHDLAQLTQSDVDWTDVASIAKVMHANMEDVLPPDTRLRLYGRDAVRGYVYYLNIILDSMWWYDSQDYTFYQHEIPWVLNEVLVTGDWITAGKILMKAEWLNEIYEVVDYIAKNAYIKRLGTLTDTVATHGRSLENNINTTDWEAARAEGRDNANGHLASRSTNNISVNERQIPFVGTQVTKSGSYFIDYVTESNDTFSLYDISWKFASDSWSDKVGIDATIFKGWWDAFINPPFLYMRSGTLNVRRLTDLIWKLNSTTEATLFPFEGYHSHVEDVTKSNLDFNNPTLFEYVYGIGDFTTWDVPTDGMPANWNNTTVYATGDTCTLGLVWESTIDANVGNSPIIYEALKHVGSSVWKPYENSLGWVEPGISYPTITGYAHGTPPFRGFMIMPKFSWT